MPRRNQIEDATIIAGIAALEENHRAAGLRPPSVRAQAEALGIPHATLVGRLRKMKGQMALTSKADYRRWLPDRVNPAHLTDRYHLMLRAAADAEAGETLSNAQNGGRAERFAMFQDLMTSMILTYDYGEGYTLVPRLESDGIAYLRR